MEWDDLRYVIAVERAGTLSAAAKLLDVNQSTVTRRLLALEAQLGESPVVRRGGRYVLSPLGERLRPFLAGMEDHALAIERAAHGAGGQPSGPVRLTTAETLATTFLAPRLPRFRAAHPAIELELEISRHSADLGRREADLALRLVRPRQPGLVARKVGAVGIALYAQAAYLRTRRVPALSGRWDRFAIVTGEESNAWSPEARLLGSLSGATTIALRTASWLTQTAAVEAGAGIGALPCLVADARPSLRRIGGADATAQRELWLIVHRDLQHTGRVRAVFDFVAAQIAAGARELLG